MVEKLEKIDNFKDIHTSYLRKGDVIVIKIDQDIWDISDAQKIVESIADTFVDNDILCMFKGVDISIIRRQL